MKNCVQNVVCWNVPNHFEKVFLKPLFNFLFRQCVWMLFSCVWSQCWKTIPQCLGTKRMTLFCIVLWCEYILAEKTTQFVVFCQMQKIMLLLWMNVCSFNKKNTLLYFQTSYCQSKIRKCHFFVFCEILHPGKHCSLFWTKNYNVGKIEF